MGREVTGNPYFDAFKAYGFTWVRQADAARAVGTSTPNIAVLLRRGMLSGININGFVYVSMKSIEMYNDRKRNNKEF